MASPVSSVDPSSKAAQLDQYVTRQISRTTAQVRWVEIATSLVFVFAIAFGMVFAFCLIDAWLISFSSIFRLLFLLSTVIGCCGIFVWQTLPLLIRKINPVYAAQMIERSSPGIKNSLLNYLTLRDQRISQNVKQMLQNRAVNDLSKAPIENSIDRTNLIRIGFIVVGMFALAIGYKLFSPKDPFHSVARLTAPLANISSPSRVRITSVKPGNSEVFFGDSIDVVASIRGMRSEDIPVLVYSSLDGEIRDKVLPLYVDPQTANFKTKTFVNLLAATENGIQRSIRYRIVAGDTKSEYYEITVSAKPTLTVSSLKLTPPAYTELPELSLGRKTDINGIEGSRVNIEALANLPIQNASIELLNQVGVEEFTKIQSIEMTTTEDSANGEFVLKLNSDRSKGEFSHYRLTLLSTSGKQSTNETIYPIEIQPDLKPEVEIVSPTSRETELAANRSMPILIRANDPDFKISWIELTIVHRGSEKFKEHLPLDQPNSLGPVRGQFEFRPEKLGLNPGDVVVFFAKAADNRTSPTSQLPDPNISSTGNYQVTILANESNSSDKSEDQESKSDANETDSGTKDEQPGNNSDSNSKDTDNKDSNNKDADNKDTKQDKNGSGESKDDSSTAKGKNKPKDQGKDENKSNKDNEDGGGDDKGDQSSGKSDKKDDSQQQSKDGNSGNEKQKGDSKSDEKSGSDSQKNDSSQASGDNTKQSDQNQQKSDSKGDGQSSEQSADNKSEKNGSEQQKSDKNSSSDNNQQKGGEKSGDGSESQMTEGADKADKSSADGGGKKQDQSTNDKSRSGSGEKDSQNSSGNNKESVGEKGDQTSPQNSSAQEQGSSSESESADQPKPLDKNAHDGEVFDRVDKRRRENENKQSGNSKDSNPTDPSGQGNSREPGVNPDSNQSGNSKSNERPSDSDSKKENQSNEKNKKSGKTGDNAKPAIDQKTDEKTPDQGSGSNEKDDREFDNSNNRQGDKNDKAVGQDKKSGDENNNQKSTGNKKSNGKAGDENKSGDVNQQSENGKSDQGTKSNDDSGDKNSADESGTGQSETSDDNESKSEKSNNNKSETGNQKNSSSQPTGDGGTQRGGGKPGDGVNNTQRIIEEDLTPEEKEDLNHSKKVTDLALEYLEDQKNDPDQELLDELNWSKDDLNRFVDRWKKMKDKAKAGSIEEQKEFERSLRSLGLKPSDSKSVLDAVKSDNVTGLNEDGAVTKPPAEFAREFLEFQRQRAKSNQK